MLPEAGVPSAAYAGFPFGRRAWRRSPRSDPSHHWRQRSGLRRSIPSAPRSRRTRSGLRPCRIAETRTTSSPGYTRRRNKRTEGGVFRRRQPSRPQHKLKRTSHCGPSRGLRASSLGRVCSHNGDSPQDAPPPPNRHRPSPATDRTVDPPDGSGTTSLQCLPSTRMNRRAETLPGRALRGSQGSGGVVRRAVVASTPIAERGDQGRASAKLTHSCRKKTSAANRVAALSATLAMARGGGCRVQRGVRRSAPPPGQPHEPRRSPAAVPAGWPRRRAPRCDHPRLDPRSLP